MEILITLVLIGMVIYLLPYIIAAAFIAITLVAAVVGGVAALIKSAVDKR